MLDKVIDTYRCLLSCHKKMPGMKLEDAFNEEAMEQIEKEYKWLKDQKEGDKIGAL